MQELQKLTTPQLHKLLGEQLTVSAEALENAARIYAELRTRGADLSRYRTGIGLYLARIADKKLSAHAVQAFAGQPGALHRFVGLSLSMQKALAVGHPVSVAEHDEAGKIIFTDKRVERMTGPEVLRVFQKPGEIASPEEQAAVLKRSAGPRKHRSVKLDIRADVAKGEIIIGQIRVKPHDLAAALGALGFTITRKVSK